MGVTPPPHSPILQQRPNDYGIPMEVEVAYIQDGFLTNDVLQEMVSLGWGPPKPPSSPAGRSARPPSPTRPRPAVSPGDGDNLFSIVPDPWGSPGACSPSLPPPQTLLVEFYKGAPDLVKFQELWSQDQTYLDKLKVRQGLPPLG